MAARCRREITPTLHDDDDYYFSSSEEESMETEELQLEDEKSSDSETEEEEEEETCPNTTDQISYTSNSKPFQFTWKKEEDDFSMVGKQFRGIIPIGSNIKEAKNKKKLDFLLEFISMNYWKKVVEFSNSKGWSYVLTLPKLFIWLGLVIYITLAQCPVINEIWNEDKPLYYRTHINKHMTRDEFWKISGIISLYNHKKNKSKDKLGKFRTMIEELRKNCKKKYNPAKFLCIDQTSPGYSGRCFLKRRRRDKKVSKSIYVLTDAATHYCINFEFVDDNIAQQNNVNGLSRTQAVVTRLLNHITTPGHCVVTNNYFSSPALAYLLFERGFTCLGTWKQNMGMPKDFQLKITSGKQLESIRNGPPKTISVQNILKDGKAIKPRITCVGVSLYSPSPVTMLFTEKFDVNSKIEGGKNNALKFSFQHCYNGTKNGVKTLDQAVKHFSTYIRSRKYWKRIFHWTYDVAKENAYISYTQKVEVISRRDFMTELADELIEKAKELQESEDLEDSNSGDNTNVKLARYRITDTCKHFDLRSTGIHKRLNLAKEKKCVLCQRENNHKRTPVFCTTCKKCICEDHWVKWHTEEDI